MKTLDAAHLKSPSGISISNDSFSMAAYKAGLSIVTAPEDGAIFDKIKQEIEELIGADYVSIYLSRGEELTKVYTSFSTLSNIHPRKNGFTYKAYQDSSSYVLDNQRVFSIHPEVRTLQIASTLFIPLTFEAQPIGVISADFLKPTSFSLETLEVLKLFGSLISYKIKNADTIKNLRQLVESQQFFISLTSHEIKNPLTAALAYTQLTQQHLKKNQNADPVVVEKLLYELQRVSTLINELRSFKDTPITELNLHFQKQPHRTTKIIKHAITNFKLAYPHRSVRFYNKTAPAPLVLGDYQKLLQLLTNILTNAAKFSPDKSFIYLNLKLQEETIIIQIKDKGKGIPAKYLPHIFDPYYRVKSSQKKEGMGLGLFISKKIVEEHGGTLTAHSKFRKGTTIEIQLPTHHVAP